MEIILIAVVAVALGAFIYYNRSSKSFDVNNDGKVDAADAKAAVQNVVEGVKATADVNQDGKVDSADVAVVTEKVKTGAKKAAVKAKETVAKKVGRKPKSKA
jgi:Na+-translocating ferredoxin:NAD+ oxidoreductase RNF subunit RnfB